MSTQINPTKPREMAPNPPMVVPDTVAIVVSEYGGLEPPMPGGGWYVYFKNDRPKPTPEVFGRLCVLGVEGGDAFLVGRLSEGPDGTFNVELYAPWKRMMAAVAVDWAAPVTALMPATPVDLKSRFAPGPTERVDVDEDV